MKKATAAFLTLSLAAAGCLPAGPGSPAPSIATATPSVAESHVARASAFASGLNEPWKTVWEGPKLQNASAYRIEITLGEDILSFTGRERVDFTNSESVPLDQVRFRLFPNILGGETAVQQVTVDGREVKPRLELRDSVLIVPMDPPLLPRDSARIGLQFSARIAENVSLNYGVQAYTEGVLALAHFYPMLEVFDESGWNAEIPPPAGDVSYADASSFVVQIDAPAGLTIIGTGVETARSVVADRQVVEFAAGPARDFYLAASDQYMKSSQAAGNVALHFYAPAGRASGAARALEFAANAVAYFSERFGPYPYVELDLVATPNQALGIEYPGVIAIADRILDPQDERLEATVVHEVAHQWFYNLVGNDQLDQPWLDESFAQYATLEYFGHEYGEAGRQGFLQYLQARWESVGSPDMPVGLPVAAYTDQEYGAIVYGRGPLFIDTLREQIGDAAFERFLETYLVTFAWGIATEDGFKRAAQESCGCNLNALFETWVD